MDLFGKDGMMTQIFSANDTKWKSYKNHDKGKHMFMVNRMFAINFPVQAQQMNVNGINPYVVVETWRMIAKQFKRAPGWIWTKANKPNAIKKKKAKYTPSDAVIKFYIDKNEISRVQFNDAMKYHPEELCAYLQRIEKQMEVHD